MKTILTILALSAGFASAQTNFQILSLKINATNKTQRVITWYSPFTNSTPYSLLASCAIAVGPGGAIVSSSMPNGTNSLPFSDTAGCASSNRWYTIQRRFGSEADWIDDGIEILTNADFANWPEENSFTNVADTNAIQSIIDDIYNKFHGNSLIYRPNDR